MKIYSSIISLFLLIPYVFGLADLSSLNTSTPSIFRLFGLDVKREVEPYEWAADHRIIAHGLGEINGHPVTNCLEAFEENYKKGYRLFEVDLILTSDNVLVARHDWNPYMFNYLGQHGVSDDQYGRALTYHEFKNLPIHGQYHPLDIKDLARLLKEYPDAYFLTDTKGTKEEDIRKTFDVLVKSVLEEEPEVMDRFIPQIYNENMLRIVREYYDFKHVIYTLYQTLASEDKIIKFAVENNIRAITISENKVNRGFINKLSNHGIFTYIHTINNFEVAKFYTEEVGLTGIYTDNLTPELLPILEQKE